MGVSALCRCGAIVLLVLWVHALAVAGPRVLIRCANEGGETWRYTTDKPGDRWTEPGFEDGDWAKGKAGFGVTDSVTPRSTVGTPWDTSDIWLRKSIDVPAPLEFTRAGLTVRHDEDVAVYVNGALVFSAVGYNTAWTAYDVTSELKAALRPGRNVVAVHVTQTRGGQYIDVGLALDPKRKLAVPVRPMSPAALQKLRDVRWPAEKAWKWYAEVGPICGCNYVPRTAVNTTEMWQKETFDPKTIEQELGWARQHGLNSVRVFVQYIVYEADPEGLTQRMDRFLAIAAGHGISTMFVLFDDCFKPEPKLGKQPDPVPGVHNSQWTSSPGNHRKAREHWPRLEKYVRHVVGRFARDGRVLVWDLYNEPKRQSRPLVEAAFAWARAVKPSQPLTTCWQASDLCDVVSFHDYGKPDPRRLARWTAERPAICTECIARGRGSTFEAVLPAFAKEGIGWYMWGLVKGRIQTHYPWGSPKGAPEPKRWHHDLLRPDGSPHRPNEIELIRCFPEQWRLHRRN